MISRCPVRFAALVFAVTTSPLLAQSLSNLSTRAQVGTGANILVAGFSITGGSKTVLVRAGGPALTQFGLTGTLANPRLELYRLSDNTRIAENDDWGAPLGGATTITATTFTSVGAFAFPAGSRDAALLTTLPEGNYSAQVNGVGNTSGLAIVEVYDVSGAGRLVNLSTRAQVGTGANVLIPGVVIAPGSGTRRLLIRAAGPALAAFGLTTGTLANPTLTIANGPGAPPFFASNDNLEHARERRIDSHRGFLERGRFRLRPREQRRRRHRRPGPGELHDPDQRRRQHHRPRARGGLRHHARRHRGGFPRRHRSERR